MKIIQIDLSNSDKNVKDFNKKHFASIANVSIDNIKKYYPDIKFELWKVYNPKHWSYRGNTKITENGIHYRLFPIDFIMGESQFISKNLLIEIDKLRAKNKKIIVHLQTVHNLMDILVALKCKNLPLLVQQRGPNMPASIKYKFKKSIFHFLLSFIDNHSIKNFDHALCSSYGEYVYLSKLLGTKLTTFTKGSGFNFDSEFEKIDVKALKKDLGISTNKPVLLHVGRFNDLKGVPTILDLITDKKNSIDFQMIFVGGSKEDKYYNKIISTDSLVREHIKHNEVLNYISCSDIILLSTSNKEFLLFSDIPRTVIESISLNKPVISNLLVHFPGTKEEKSKLGIMAYKKDKIRESIIKIISDYKYYSNTREVAKKYYDWEIIANLNHKIYLELFKKYYN